MVFWADNRMRMMLGGEDDLRSDYDSLTDGSDLLELGLASAKTGPNLRVGEAAPAIRRSMVRLL